jgi:chromosome segregation ATPase
LASEKKHVDSLANLSNKLRDMEGDVDSLTRQRNDLQLQNRQIQEENLKLRGDLADEKQNNSELANELDALNKKLKLTHTSVDLLQSLQEQRDGILRDLDKLRIQNQNFQQQMENLEADVLQKGRDLAAAERRNQDDLKRLSA